MNRDIPICPMCDSETNTFYENDNRDIVGCEHCVCLIDAWEWRDDYEIGRRDAELEFKWQQQEDIRRGI